MATLTVQPAHPITFDDEMMALALQLEEIDNQSTVQKGKYNVDSPPDTELAFAAFQKEIQMSMQILSDLKLAQSFAQAIVTDAQEIAESVQDESRAVGDRRLALQLSGQNPNDDIAPPPYDEGQSLGSDHGGIHMSGLYAEMQMQALREPSCFWEDEVGQLPMWPFPVEEAFL
ncbi:hypothetical protein E2P81_ATG04113 [Venturia nashicola]|uniref:Uncharacterized protein n=1 Tax=Venturia nashicola TaxID=86259 RepID=A0A4Z1PA07_9PEZI|nr:hypothetical protein E6O75_ATG04213 [Venturia nashicola]TLD37301.1 hypothetical protein E2P81_ATG04113 [Venturia nashicola]